MKPIKVIVLSAFLICFYSNLSAGIFEKTYDMSSYSIRLYFNHINGKVDSICFNPVSKNRWFVFHILDSTTILGKDNPHIFHIRDGGDAYEISANATYSVIQLRKWDAVNKHLIDNEFIEIYERFNFQGLGLDVFDGDNLSIAIEEPEEASGQPVVTYYSKGEEYVFKVDHVDRDLLSATLYVSDGRNVKYMISLKYSDITINSLDLYKLDENGLVDAKSHWAFRKRVL